MSEVNEAKNAAIPSAETTDELKADKQARDPLSTSEFYDLLYHYHNADGYINRSTAIKNLKNYIRKHFALRAR